VRPKLPKTAAEDRENYIIVTAGLIKRDIEYTRKPEANWPTMKIKRRYDHAMWNGFRGKPAPDVKWWAMRKRAMEREVQHQALATPSDGRLPCQGDS
jgi:hypothetical protein